MDKENKLRIFYTHTHPSLKEGYLPFVTTWMDLGGTVLSQINEIVKGKHRVISLICGIKRKPNS